LNLDDEAEKGSGTEFICSLHRKSIRFNFGFVEGPLATKEDETVASYLAP
jgi:hypothetical protein